MSSSSSRRTKSSRRQQAAESLAELENFDESDHGYPSDDDKAGAESWSSHDISAGANKSRSGGGSRKLSGGSSSDRHRSRGGSSRDGPTSPYKNLSKLSVSSTSLGGNSARRKSSRGDSSVASSSSRSRRASASDATSGAGASAGNDKLARILELGNKYKQMKQEHEMAAQQATSRRVDLTKEVF